VGFTLCFEYASLSGLKGRHISAMGEAHRVRTSLLVLKSDQNFGGLKYLLYF